jgi:hypothetical protein
MGHIISRLAGVGLFALSLLAATPSGAGQLAEFNAAVDKAFAHYRGALFYLRRKNGDPAAFELELFKDAWQGIAKKWGGTSPDAFAGDAAWKRTLDAIAKAADSGLALAEKDTAAARKALLPIRDELSALRRRNGVIVFSDCIEEMNDQMKKIWPYRRNPPDFEKLEQVNDVKRAASVYQYLLGKCRAKAPEAYRKNAEFNRLFDAAERSVGTLWDATDKKQRQRFINILRELNPLDRLIFLRFG